MEKFEFSLETKHTVWYRTNVEIEASSLEEAIQKAKELGSDIEVEGEYLDSEIIDDTIEYLSVGDNDGQPTAEIRVTSTDEIIWDNVQGTK